MEFILDKKYIEKLYILLGISIFIHYIFVVFFTLLIVLEFIKMKRYKKIFEDRALFFIDMVLIFSVVMSLYYSNFYGLIAIPILFCVIVGRYFTNQIDMNLKKDLFKIVCKMSIIPFFISIFEYLITKDRVGFFSYLNPNYLGSLMVISSIANLYVYFKKESKENLVYFILNFITLLMTGSRSSLISIVASIVILLYKFLKKKNFFIFITLLFIYTVGAINNIFPFLRSSTLIEYFWLRVDIIKMAFTIFKKTNFLYGHGNFYYYKFTNHVYPHSHNALVESLLSYGLIGTIGVIIVFSKYIYENFKRNKENILQISLLTGVIINNITDLTIFWIQTVMLFIIVFSYSENSSKNKF